MACPAVRERARIDHDTDPLRSRTFQVEFDFVDHRLVIETSDGTIREIALRPQAVADFYGEYVEVLAGLGIAVRLWPVVPTITLEGDANGAPRPGASAHAKKFSGKYAHRVIKGGVGHNLPQEAPQAFANAIVEVDGY